MSNIINSNAYGQFTQHGIVLKAGADFSHLYHEAFHGFSQLFLTPEQKQQLYGEVQKLFPGISPYHAEEKLAEDFRSYVKSGGKLLFGKSPVKNSIFRRI